MDLHFRLLLYCPFSLYPNVYTFPVTLSSTLWLSPAEIFPIVSGNSISVNVFDFPPSFPVWIFTFLVVDAVNISLSVSTGVAYFLFVVSFVNNCP
jgi:hypothetical protein